MCARVTRELHQTTRNLYPRKCICMSLTASCLRRCTVNLEATNPDFNEGSLLDDLGRYRGASSFTGMHRTYAGASVLVATKPAELKHGLRMLEVPATCDTATDYCNMIASSLLVSLLRC